MSRPLKHGGIDKNELMKVYNLLGDDELSDVKC